MFFLLVVVAASEPIDTVRAFHAALAAGNRAAALGLLHPQASIFEAGEVESVQKYTAGHIDQNIALARSTTRTLRHESERRDGETAWVLSQAEVRGTSDGKPIDLLILESMFLVRASGDWRIAHIHWSSKRRDAPPAAPKNRGRHCIRAGESCWRCADIEFPASVPCTLPGCNGVCVERSGTKVCADAKRWCCADGEACSVPPGCDAASSCSDTEGDGRTDSCTFLSYCANTEPPATPPPRLACAPPPEPERYVGYGQSDPQARCKAARLVYEISAEEMRSGASDPTGAGLCYGIVHFDANGRQTGSACGAYHCQTLRYCDGRERSRYCTIRATCENGVARAVGFTW
jgi:hypothetical protein